MVLACLSSRVPVAASVPQKCRAGIQARHSAVRHRAPAPEAPCTQRRWQRVVAAAAADGPSSPDPAQVDGLLPEEDREIPGNYRDAMSSNTELGKAVKSACDELDTLGNLERQTLEEAEGLLKKLGFKGSLFAAAPQQPEQQQQQQQATPEA